MTCLCKKVFELEVDLEAQSEKTRSEIREYFEEYSGTIYTAKSGLHWNS